MTIRTGLRPDFYEFFPTLSRRQIQERLGRLPFHRATLLGLKNVMLVVQHQLAQAQEFLESAFSTQRDMLAEVLLQVGISPLVARGIQNVPREQFAPENYLRFCYLNHSVFYDNLSCLSAPGLIALMIDRLEIFHGQRILEIGIGSGYHAACVSECLDGECETFGIELNKEYFQFGQAALNRSGYGSIKLHCGDGFHGWPNEIEFDRIYFTNSMKGEFPPRVVAQLKDGGLIQGTRALQRAEFESEKGDSWLRNTFRSYEEYFEGDWRSYCCLITCKKENNELDEIDRLYDVSFTPFHRNPAAYKTECFDPFAELELYLKDSGVSL